MKLVPVARVVGVHGLRGFLKLESLSEFASPLAPGARLRIDGVWHVVEEVREQNGRLQAKLEGIRDRSAGEALRGKVLEGAEQAPDSASGEFRVSELVGCAVFEGERELGPVEDVISVPAQDLLQVGGVLIPLLREFVKRVDLDARRIDVALIDGMRPE